MEKYLPIIYVRGYAGSQGAVGPGSASRLVRAKWAGLDSDLPAAGKRYPRNDNIRFPLPSKNLAQGDLVLRVRDERSNSTQHLL